MSAAAAPVLSSTTVEQSYRYCRNIARRRAKNFYYSFLLLEKAQRNAMCAIYAFMRYCDDLSDDPSTTDTVKLQQTIAQWRIDLDRALEGEVEGNPLWPAFYDTVQRYSIPHRFFHEMIDGILSDVEPRQMRSFDDLYHYCYHVASVVGLTIVHIFGFHSVKALLLAEKCGIAFQLTNILRDVREDAELGRVYLPLDDLARFGVTVEQLRSGTENDAFRKLMGFESARAKAYYEESEPLMKLIDPKSRRSLWALREIYLHLLSRLEASSFSVLSQRINVPTHTKLALLLQAFLKKPS